MENEMLNTPPAAEERKNEPALISLEDMDEAIKKAVAEAVKSTRESMLKEIQDAKLREESSENAEGDYSYSALVEDLE